MMTTHRPSGPAAGTGALVLGLALGLALALTGCQSPVPPSAPSADAASESSRGLAPGGWERTAPPLFLTVDQLKTWTSAGPTASAANVSSVALAPRQKILASQLNPNQSFGMKVDYVPDGMDIWAGFVTERSQFNLFNFTHWQYIDKLTWFANAADGVFIPSKPWIEAAHRNGVKIVGTVFFGASSSSVSALVAKSGSAYTAAQKLIDIAAYYGFDGWFFNEEVGVSQAVASDLIALLKQLQTLKPAGMEISWYDSMLASGRLSWQNALNDANKALLQDGPTRVSDEFFTNYNWGGSQVSSSVSTAAALGRSALDDLYMGCDIWNGRTGAQGLFTYNPGFLNSLYTGGNLTQPRTSMAVFAANLTWNAGFHKFDTDPSDYANFYKTEVRLFSGDDGDVTQADASGWKGFGYYLPVRTVITSLPFETTFNVGQGKIWAVDGQVSARNWTDIGKQSLLPSWQWAKTGPAAVTVGWDFDRAWQGGTSVRLAGTPGPTEATVKLFQTKLALTAQSKLDLTAQAGASGATNLQVLLYFSDALTAPAALDLGAASGTAWTTTTFDLGPYAGRELAVIGLRVRAPNTGTNWSMNVGALKVYNGGGTVTAPGPASAPSVASGATGVGLSTVLSWTPGTGTASHDVWFGTTNPPAFAGTQSAASYVPALAPNTTYWWRVDEKNAAGTTAGPLWSFTTGAAPANPVPVSLAGAFNLTAAFAADGQSFSPSGGLDGVGYAYSGTLLGTSVSWNGTSFNLGPAGGSDAVTASGQTLSLPAGSYASLRFLGAAVNGNQAAQTFTVTYTDGTAQTFSQGISDWFTPQSYSGEAAAKSMAYRVTSAGGKDNRTFHLYGYGLALNKAKTVASVKLPSNAKVKVLAVTLVP